MIGRLAGELLQKQPPYLLIDVHGVGYEIQAPMSTFYQLPEPGGQIVLLIHMVVREDAQLLYGFYSRQEKLLFKSLIKVNGVGPKLALAILSGINANDFVLAVKNNDITGLTRLPGIGKKTAERLVVEMRDKLSDWLENEKPSGNEADLVPTVPKADEKELIKEATGALIALGYKPVEASKMIAAIELSSVQNSEMLIKQALKNSLK